MGKQVISLNFDIDVKMPEAAIVSNVMQNPSLKLLSAKNASVSLRIYRGLQRFHLL